MSGRLVLPVMTDRRRPFTLALIALGGLLGADSPPQQGSEPLELEGIIVPFQDVEVSASIDAVIESILVDRGSEVEKGQIVATLESSVERALLEVARARAGKEATLRSSKTRLELLTKKLEQSQSLFERGIISPERFEELRTEKLLADLTLLDEQEKLAISQQELERAQASLRLHTIRSPISGVVVERYRAPGERVHTAQSHVLRIAQIDPLNVEIVAPVALLDRIRVGMEAKVSPVGPVRGEYRAVVTVVDRVVDAATATFGARLELPNPDRTLPAGLTCVVVFRPD